LLSLRKVSEESGLWFLLVFCGAYDWKETKNVLMVLQLASLNLKARCLTTLSRWVNLTPVYNPDSFLDFISSLVLC